MNMKVMHDYLYFDCPLAVELILFLFVLYIAFIYAIPFKNVVTLVLFWCMRYTTKKHCG